MAKSRTLLTSSTNLFPCTSQRSHPYFTEAIVLVTSKCDNLAVGLMSSYFLLHYAVNEGAITQYRTINHSSWAGRVYCLAVHQLGCLLLSFRRVPLFSVLVGLCIRHSKNPIQLPDLKASSFPSFFSGLNLSGSPMTTTEPFWRLAQLEISLSSSSSNNWYSPGFLVVCRCQ